jgi:hypothetical protein
MGQLDSTCTAPTTTGRPAASAQRTFFERPSGGAVRKCVKSAAEVVTAPLSFSICDVNFSCCCSSKPTEMSTRTP